MKLGIVSALVISLLLISQAEASKAPRKYKYTDPLNPGRVAPTSSIRKEVIKTKLDPVDLPTNFTWHDVNGINYLTNVKNQHIPQYCGSCWSQAVTSAMSDRIKIMRNATWPDINIAPQILLSCAIESYNSKGCNGGDELAAY
jgi:cathepsin X